MHNCITAKRKTQSYFGSFLFSNRDTTATAIYIKSSTHYEFRGAYTGKIFAPKFYQDRANRNFLQFMRLVKKHPAKRNYPTENGTYGRVLYEYVPKSSRYAYSFDQRNLEFPFPDNWYPNKGYTITGFSYVFKDAPVKINNLLKPSGNLINDFANDNKEDFHHSLITNIFFDVDTFKKKVKEYGEIELKEFINQSFFLYDKSNAIKKTFITALNKEISIYGSFSFFPGKKN